MKYLFYALLVMVAIAAVIVIGAYALIMVQM